MTRKNTLGKAAAVVLMAALVSACSSNAAKEEAAAQAIKTNELATSNEHLKNVTNEQCHTVITLF